MQLILFTYLYNVDLTSNDPAAILSPTHTNTHTHIVICAKLDCWSLSLPRKPGSKVMTRHAHTFCIFFCLPVFRVFTKKETQKKQQHAYMHPTLHHQSGFSPMLICTVISVSSRVCLGTPRLGSQSLAKRDNGYLLFLHICLLFIFSIIFTLG